jgi:hypothetical protein
MSEKDGEVDMRIKVINRFGWFINAYEVFASVVGCN